MLRLELQDYVSRNTYAKDKAAFDRLYEFERHVMSNVTSGKLPANDTGLPPVSNKHFLALIPEPVNLSLIRNQCLVLTALATSHSIASGVDTRLAITIYIYYQEKLTALTTEEEIDALANRMLDDYASVCSKTKISPSVPGRVRNAMEFIRGNLNRPLKIEEVARYVGKSTSQIDKDFRKYLGCTPKEFIMREKLSEASDYLTYTGQSITEISRLMGFSSTAHFSNTFTAAFGISPSEYRKFHLH